MAFFLTLRFNRPYATPYSLLGYLSDNLSILKFESSFDSKTDSDECLECELYAVDQVEQVLGQKELDDIAKMYKLPPYVKLHQ